MIREALIPLLPDIKTESASMLFLELRFLDTVYMQRVAHLLTVYGQTKGVADAMSRYTSILPVILGYVSENDRPSRIRSFTNDTLLSTLPRYREHDDICRALGDVQEDIAKLLITLEKPIRYKKKRAQIVIDMLTVRSVLEDICTAMFMQEYFAYTTPESPIHRNIQASRGDLDDQGNMVIEIMDDGVSQRARFAVQRLMNLSKSMQPYLENS